MTRYKFIVLLAIVATTACSSSKSSGQRLDEVLASARAAEQACGLKEGAIDVFFYDTRNPNTLGIGVGCPGTPLDSCIRKFKAERKLGDEKFPLRIPAPGTCGGVE